MQFKKYGHKTMSNMETLLIILSAKIKNLCKSSLNIKG